MFFCFKQNRKYFTIRICWYLFVTFTSIHSSFLRNVQKRSTGYVKILYLYSYSYKCQYLRIFHKLQKRNKTCSLIKGTPLGVFMFSTNSVSCGTTHSIESFFDLQYLSTKNRRDSDVRNH